MQISVYEWLEDFDNSELEFNDWFETLEEAVKDYNEQYSAKYDPRKVVKEYIRLCCTQDE